MIIDTHTHIFEKEFDEDRDKVIQRAKDAGVSKMVLPNINTESIGRLKELTMSDRNTFIPAMGLHPTEINANYRSDLETIKTELFGGEYKAVGEIGMDLYWDKEFEREQTKAFEMQLDWAAELSLPVLIHSRNSFREGINAVKHSRCRKGIFHCFGGTTEEAEEETAETEEAPEQKKDPKNGKFGFLFKEISFGKKKKDNDGEDK